MTARTPFKRLILRAVLRNVNPMVIRVGSTDLDLPTFDNVFCTLLGWDGVGYIFRIHGQDLWEWEVRILDLEEGADGDDAPMCLGGRGAAPPEHCGGPTGYRLMLKRQKQGESMCTPAQVETVIGMLSASGPDVPTSTWDLLQRTLDNGFDSIDKRLEQYGPLDPERFSLKEANERLAKLVEHGKFRV